MNLDKLVINLRDNEEVRDYLSNKGPGENCVLEVVASLDETATNHAVMSVKEVTVLEEPADEAPSAPEDGGEEGGGMGKDEPPAAAVVALGGKQKRNKLTDDDEY